MSEKPKAETQTQEALQKIEAPQLPQRHSALAVMASRYSVEPNKLLDTLKATVFKGATNEQLLALVVVANEYNLNPFTKQIYAFPDKGGGIVPVIGIDGWLHMMNDHPQFDGLTCEMVEDGATAKPHSCTVTIYRKDRTHPVTSTEYLAECFRNTEPWNKQPRRMLRHRATIQAIRVAFGFSAMDPDEAEPIYGTVVEVNPVPDFGAPRQLGPVPAPKAKEVKETIKAPEPAKTKTEQPELAPTDEPTRES